ncbi:MAG: hypothetical protein IJ149_01875 [Oscillospiraceae bacterium]|nr:hypothetical protein [Oscillospiraceae bacterium]
MNITFDALPSTLEEMQACPYGSLSEPEYGAALFLAAMLVYPKNKEEAHRMIAWLKGPGGLNEYQKQFLRDRMMDGRDYVVRSYFVGSSPENDYTFDMPATTVDMVRRPETPVEGRMRVFMKSTGADSEREIRMRLKPSEGKWYMEDQMLLAMIRVPVSKDDWA